jgi:hypothetical protein
MKKQLYKITLLLFLFAKTTVIIAQYTGSTDDGTAMLVYNKQSITDATAFKGGADDGAALFTYFKQSITDVTAFKGGTNDGFAVVTYFKQPITDVTAFKGGTNDGFAVVTYFKQPITDVTAFKGGTNDGFVVTTYFKQPITDILAFKGGNGRGETQKLYQMPYCNGIAIRTWNGSVSTAWENPSNWDCGILPVINSEVIIPTTVPRYPVVNFNFEIKKLTINPNASINILPGITFKLNGF